MPDSIYILLRRLRKPLIVLICIYALAIAGFVLIPGQDDQGNVWHMSFFHAFYFVSYMASTIGFGEIPYAFTNAQRMWAMFTIYATVIGWLYSVGVLLSVLQDPAFRHLRSQYIFQRKVQQLHMPFYIVCGYGDTGSILVKALAEDGMNAVIVDQDETRIRELELNDYIRHPLGLTGDASNPKVLEVAGVCNPYCKGIIALTNLDQVNLLIALATHLLNPQLRFLARADTREAVANIRSFGNNEVINPFDTFASRLSLALNRPAHYSLFEWLTGMPGGKLNERFCLQQGRCLICGYGRFGKALNEHFKKNGIPSRIIEPDPEDTDPDDLIKGLGTGAATLRRAGIEEATIIVAGTDNDANNLSILMTAREIKPDIFTVARQNSQKNTQIFERADFHLIMRRGHAVAHKLYALLRTPLIGDFLNLALERDEIWASQLLKRLQSIANGLTPYLWEITISHEQTPALYKACSPEQTEPVTLATLLRVPAQRETTLNVIPLLLKREGAVLLLPDKTTGLQVDDRILMCATRQVHNDMSWATHNEGVLHYLLTGEELTGTTWIWRWWQSKTEQAKG